MKEASGEANLTVITIVLISIVAAVATPLITSLVNNSAKSACCTGAGYQWKNGTCKTNDGSDATGWWDTTNNKCAY